MSDYRTADGRARVFSVEQRGEWHRRTNQRGGLQVLWHAYNVEEDRWIARDYFTLKELRKKLGDLGYSITLRRDRTA